MATRKTILFVLTTVLSFALNGQNILIKGRVLDAEYLTPVPYAAVYIHNTPIGVVTDNVGEFSFEAPLSLKHETLVVARHKYEIQYLKLDEQLFSEMIVFMEPDNFAIRSKEFQDSLNAGSNKFASTVSKVADFIKDDWIPLGNPQTNKFDAGRIQTFPTYNPIEGLRLRAGVASNSRLSTNFFMSSYVAYGFGDHRWKYRGELTYSFDKKVYHENEFPKNKLALVYENDLYSPGEMHPRSPNNLLLITFRRSENEATYRNFAEVNYEREYKNGLAHTFWVRRSRLTPQGSLRFDYQLDNMGFNDKELVNSEAGVLVRYSFGEAYEQQKRRRKPIELTSPVFFLSHTVGAYVQFDKSHTYYRSELSAQKRFLLGNTGRLDAVGEVMKVWSRVPFPLLVYPNQRHRHHIENNAFFLNRALEFVADEQYTFRFTFVGDDLLLAKIPIMNQLQIRELISLRASYGRLSDINLPGNAELYDFPDISFEYDSVPYVEGTIGFTNLLGLLRVEYVHRFTYRHHPDALLGKIRVDVTL